MWKLTGAKQGMFFFEKGGELLLVAPITVRELLLYRLVYGVLPVAERDKVPEEVRKEVYEILKRLSEHPERSFPEVIKLWEGPSELFPYGFIWKPERRQNEQGADSLRG